MTERYLGSIISPSPVEPSEGFADSTASGVWNVHDPLIFGQAGDWPDPTNASPSKFIENLFSCFAYTGNDGSKTITNGIDLSNKGGLVWIKDRSATEQHRLFDTERGATYYLTSNSTAQHYAGFNQAFTSSGFSFNSSDASVNENGDNYISWTFRKQPKFFDVVTATADSSGSILINHNLGTAPGFVMVKRTDSTGSWFCYHRSLSSPLDQYLQLNTTGAAGNFSGAFSNVTSTTFQSNLGFPTGSEIVFYLFAHNDSDGGFGSTGDQDVIKCGSYTGNANADGPEIDLGFEPQWLLIKSANDATRWVILDNIRGLAEGSTPTLLPNATSAEASEALLKLTATGFKILDADTSVNASGSTITYVAIRRGPMKAPTAGTQVFFPDLITANQSGITATGIGFSPDVIINLVRSNANYGQQICNRLTGPTKQLFTNYNSAEATTNGTALVSFDMDGYTLGSDSAGTGWNAYSGYTSVKHCFKRAPGFLDVVTYSGDGTSSRNIKHNLTVAPELILLKNRTSGGGGAGWIAGVASLGSDEGSLHSDSQFNAYNLITTYGTTTFTAQNADEQINKSGETYVAYLFATVAGVSKVGTYSGTGSDINVDCGFTSGARFVLAKRTDSSGDWYVWDSARGIVAGNDPYLLISGAAAEVTNTDYIDPLSSGFTITSNAQSDLNTSGGTYLFLAIA